MKRPGVCGLIVWSMLWAWSAAAQAPAWPHEHSDIAPSPRVTWGKLENGLRYAILPNTTPAKLVSLRLLVLTGSLHERDDERGYAHFVEHMAFNGTRGFAPGELIKFLQREGVAFGPHVNATTFETHTLYKIDLPEATPATIADGLRVLRDFADGILFEKAEVERERGVLLSEMQTRRSLDLEHMTAVRRFLFPGTLLADRLPIGTESAIKKATPAGLRGFYAAGYRPERMVVIVAGDCASGDVEAAVRAQFAALAVHGPSRPAPVPGDLPPGAEVRATLHAEMRDGVQMDLMAVHLRDDGPDKEERRAQALQLELARAMVRRRLQRLVETRGRVISGFGLHSSATGGRFVAEVLSVAGNAKEWSALLGIAEQAQRSAAELGFDATELAGAKDNLRTTLREEAMRASSVPTPALAQALAATVEEGTVFVMPDERLAARLARLEAVTAQDCQKAWRDEWARGVRRIFVAASPQWIKVAPEKILAAYEQSRTAPVTAATALADTKFAYEDFGPAGAVVQREHVADLDVWQVRFANGVRLNLKRTAFEHGRVHFRLRFGEGRAAEPVEHPGLGLWAGGLVGGGLNKHTNEEMRQAMRGHAVTLNMRAEDDACQMTGATTGDDLRRFLQVATAYLVDPAWRSDDEPRVRRLLGEVYAKNRSQPEGAMQTSVLSFLAGGDTRIGLPAREMTEKHSFATLAAWLKPMLEASPIEVTLVGDLDVDAAIAEVAKTFGTLPTRSEAVPAPTAARKLKLPQPPETRRFSYPAVAGRPTTLVLDWPVRDVLTMTERRRLRLLAGILGDRLRVQIREEKGATYVFDASLVYSETFPGLASLRCRLDVATKSAKKIADQGSAIASELAKKGVTAEELARAQAQAVAGARQQLSRNEFWLDTLDDSQTRPGRLDELRSLEHDYAAATPAELDVLAGRYLGPKNLFRFFIEPKTAK
ncbi:MAG: insulinase family protein [Candidatus Didemnitutus sp.]|nr:insulinase family protein [Candidatus Didemnitutus sp.]